MKSKWFTKNWVFLFLVLIVVVLATVFYNWENISKTDTVQTKIKILESIQKNELDSAKAIFEDYIDSL